MPAYPDTALVLLGVLPLTACVNQPAGPSVAVMLAPNKPFQELQSEDYGCRQFAA
jgi:hypothetical protein